jgi:hypothetical protein
MTSQNADADIRSIVCSEDSEEEPVQARLCRLAPYPLSSLAARLTGATDESLAYGLDACGK